MNKNRKKWVRFYGKVKAVCRSKRTLKDILNSHAASGELKTTNRTLIEHQLKEGIVTRIGTDKNLESDGSTVRRF